MKNINIISWNIENFIKIDEIINNHRLIQLLINTDIIFFQEWVEKIDKGILLFNILNKFESKFQYNYIDRCCIIFNTKLFKEVRQLEIPLKNISFIDIIERTYTQGIKHSSLYLSLVPVHDPTLIIHCICFHLATLNPYKHPLIHKEQMSIIMSTIVNNFNKKLKNGVIIAGDTNYRIEDNELLDSLIKYKFIKQIPGDFIDVCENSGCINTPTQSFKHLHELNFVKYAAKLWSKHKIYKCKKNPNTSDCYNNPILDNRLDFIATNLINYPKTRIIKYFKLSDHSLIKSQIILKIKDNIICKNITRKHNIKKNKKNNTKKYFN